MRLNAEEEDVVLHALRFTLEQGQGSDRDLEVMSDLVSRFGKRPVLDRPGYLDYPRGADEDVATEAAATFHTEGLEQ